MNYKLGIVCLLLASSCSAKYSLFNFGKSSKKATAKSKRSLNASVRPAAQKTQADNQMKPTPVPFGGTAPSEKYMYTPLGGRIAKAKVDAMMKSGS